jgi:peptidoglycan/LPS O-acetylase OafA/YrhL
MEDSDRGLTGVEHERLAPLTGLRGVTACAVLVAHALDVSFNYGHGDIFAPLPARMATFGMSLFFVLSGFVIQYSYAAMFAKRRVREALWQFFVARFARIYPLYIVTIFTELDYIPSGFLDTGSCCCHI